MEAFSVFWFSCVFIRCRFIYFQAISSHFGPTERSESQTSLQLSPSQHDCKRNVQETRIPMGLAVERLDDIHSGCRVSSTRVHCSGRFDQFVHYVQCDPSVAVFTTRSEPEAFALLLIATRLRDILCHSREPSGYLQCVLGA